MGFHHAVTHVIEREGGYVNDPRDPGGETKYGISKRAYPNLDIASLTLRDAQQIYKTDYWDPIRGDELHDRVAFVVFDCAVNQGVSRAVKLLQRTVGVKEDGVFGPVTLSAAKVQSWSGFVERFQAERILHYASLPTWPTFGRGWCRRAIGTAMEAVK